MRRKLWLARLAAVQHQLLSHQYTNDEGTQRNQELDPRRRPHHQKLLAPVMSFSALEADASSTIVQDQDDALTQWVLEGSQLRADFHESISQRPDLKMRLYEICEQMKTTKDDELECARLHAEVLLTEPCPVSCFA